MTFAGFGPEACSFFDRLAADNTKETFASLKPLFEEQIKGPMLSLLAEMEGRFGGEMKLFRQHRDTRFSKDKSPYKTATYGGVYNPAHALGWYAAIDAAGFYAGRGVYQMAPADLDAFRKTAASEGGEALARALASAEATGIEVSGDALKTAPRGYDKDHPRIDLIRRKNLIVGQRISVPEVTGTAPLEHALSVWERVQPIADWMDGALT